MVGLSGGSDFGVDLDEVDSSLILSILLVTWEDRSMIAMNRQNTMTLSKTMLKFLLRYFLIFE